MTPLPRRLLAVLLFPLLLGGCVVAPVGSAGVVHDSGDTRLELRVSSYPDLVLVPGLPVYYAPRLGHNYFFSDGLYWVLEGDRWYSSYWYGGPWRYVAIEYVPVYVLRVPVYYYRRPPTWFGRWHPQQPPHWSDRYGRDFEARHPGWRQWNPRALPPPAPRPDYQRHYHGRDYPATEQRQRELRERHYRHGPAREAAWQRRQEEVLQQREGWRAREREQAAREAQARETERQARLRQWQEREQARQRERDARRPDTPAWTPGRTLPEGAAPEHRVREWRGEWRAEGRGEGRGDVRGEWRGEARREGRGPAPAPEREAGGPVPDWGAVATPARRPDVQPPRRLPADVRGRAREERVREGEAAERRLRQHGSERLQDRARAAARDEARKEAREEVRKAAPARRRPGHDGDHDQDRAPEAAP